MLVASSWIAVAAQDRDLPLMHQTEAERRVAEHRTLLRAARIRVRDARSAVDAAPWYRTFAARRALRAAEAELDALEASAPPPPSTGSPLVQRLLAEPGRPSPDVGAPR